jgi:hypothetical protein
MLLDIIIFIGLLLYVIGLFIIFHKLSSKIRFFPIFIYKIFVFLVYWSIYVYIILVAIGVSLQYLTAEIIKDKYVDILWDFITRPWTIITEQRFKK